MYAGADLRREEQGGALREPLVREPAARRAHGLVVQEEGRPGESRRRGRTLTWDDGSTLALKAPAGCNGTVEAANRRIDYLGLEKRPAQWALRLAL